MGAYEIRETAERLWPHNKEDNMTGWKTWVAAIASMAYGAGGFIGGLHGPDVAVSFITGGLALIGIGHKVEKLGDVIKDASAK